jgi:hypothetical protein
VQPPTYTTAHNNRAAAENNFFYFSLSPHTAHDHKISNINKIKTCVKVIKASLRAISYKFMTSKAQDALNPDVTSTIEHAILSAVRLAAGDNI